MDVRITVETILEDGKIQRHALGIWPRPFRKMSSEAIGLMPKDAKTIVAQLQKAIVQGQVEEMSQAFRPCPRCGRVRPIHDYRSRTLDTMFGRFDDIATPASASAEECVGLRVESIVLHLQEPLY